MFKFLQANSILIKIVATQFYLKKTNALFVFVKSNKVSPLSRSTF